MSLEQRIERIDDDSIRNMNNHAFPAAVWWMVRGKITRAQLDAAFDMDAEDKVTLDQMATAFNALTGPALTTDKIQFYYGDVYAAGVLLESGLIDQAKWRSLLGLP